MVIAVRPTTIVASTIKAEPRAVSAILGGLSGGAEDEWAALIREQVYDAGSVISGFATGRIHSHTTAGLTFHTPATQPQFTGRAYDQILPTAASTAVFKGNAFELGAILRGEFRDPETSSSVFALDRGAGRRLGPTFASRPGITPDALVMIAVGPNGSSASGTIRDLTDGSTRAIDASRIAVLEATLRAFLDAGQFASQGLAPARYRFAMRTQAGPGEDIVAVASFTPDGAMTPIAVRKTVAVRR